ncbi:hypothetical protein PACTADRAFT_49854 [Pachysolen tannophilus NRRL Y-2460]|uniref:WLM domain-containing protein n=1 Tax=Pachysolen tannophilus NRRL Y-2460 TaxID=669874 RepID=A0A1E4TTN7_PACTA|nr:hypothetical protein PACTADRAFT_49854 [Pachysolen tannophilus NRRL Y-2460]
MVIKGRGPLRIKEKNHPNRPSPTSHIDKIASLKSQPLKDDALNLLHELAKLVAPIMTKHNFKVKLLCEMFPKSANLLGLNINRGAKIMIRLRHSHNKFQFIAKSELIGTFLHELTHNIYGLHNAQFYSFLDKLKTEFEDMMCKYGFDINGMVTFDDMFGNNTRLNNKISNITGNSKSNNNFFKEVHRLGSGDNSNSISTIRGKSMRELIADATDRRLKDNKTCHEATFSDGLNDNKFMEDLQKKGEIPRDQDLDIIVIEDEDEDKQRDNETNNRNSNGNKNRKRKMEPPQDDEVIILDSSNDTTINTNLNKSQNTNTKRKHTKKKAEVDEIVLIDLT